MLTLVYQVSAALMIVGLAVESDKQSRKDTAFCVVMSFIPVINTLCLLCGIYAAINNEE